MKSLIIIRVASLFSLSSALMFSTSSVYASDQVYFQGELTDQTCILSVNGSSNGNPVVNLNPVYASKLKDVGSFADGAVFSLGVTNCASSYAITPEFIAYNITGYEGGIGYGIGNIGSAKNVDLQLRNLMSNNLIMVDANGAGSAGVLLVNADGSGSIDYAVEYVSYQGNASPGTVTGLVQYAISYL
ncbi:fimbrial protein [Vibrio metschnikovii]|uniref:fimbrial protein n=1 Tax=Vibrio metschnikovii TaxID=28172 RepID=UPI001C30429F|nr:fimbrial protein [Vibrio metschnikovii]EKO3564666.1 type 1 fimbrial protein [Vibrio metschnikovii]EKO3769357.1 type 1 fimbrial protein [Vibrio metschnikovii]